MKKSNLVNIQEMYEPPEVCKKAWLIGLPQRTGSFFWYRAALGEGEFKLVSADSKLLSKPVRGEVYRAVPKYEGEKIKSVQEGSWAYFEGFVLQTFLTMEVFMFLYVQWLIYKG